MAVDLKTIDMGKNDAKLDSLEKYFFDNGTISKIRKMDKFFIIGRKGTGKTAIAYYLKKRMDSEHDLFVNIISFKDIPVQLMEQFKDNRLHLSNRFVVLWRFVLSIEIAKLFVQDQSIDAAVEKKIKTFLEMVTPSLKSGPKDYLQKAQEIGWSLGTDIASISTTTTYTAPKINLVTYADSLLDILTKEIHGGTNYHILLDELDDIYEDKEEYYGIVIALFKATMDINSKFLLEHKQASAVVLLRDDIYNKLQYPDKNKWRDVGVFLDWTPRKDIPWYEQELFKIANERIGVSIDGQTVRGKNYWSMIFTNTKLTEYEYPFSFIISRTFFRPRDIIQYVKDSIEVAISHGKDVIDRDAILETDKKFGIWFKGELTDELSTAIPNVQEVFEILKLNQRPVFYLSEMSSIFGRHKIDTKYSVSELFNILYEYSIIGQFVDEKTTAPIFKYKQPSLKFNPNNKLCLHYGLRSVLELHYKGKRSHLRSFVRHKQNWKA